MHIRLARYIHFGRDVMAAVRHNNCSTANGLFFLSDVTRRESVGKLVPIDQCSVPSPPQGHMDKQPFQKNSKNRANGV